MLLDQDYKLGKECECLVRVMISVISNVRAANRIRVFWGVVFGHDQEV